MSIEIVNRLLHEKENIRLEFKKAKNALPSNLFESICAMLNRDGGDILLGVNDNGTVEGIDSEILESLVTHIVNLSNNPQKIDPPFILFPIKQQIEGKDILHIQIPSSSQLHKTVGIVFDRSNDGDFRVNNPAQIANLYNKKRLHFTENTLYPFLKFSDFKKELFPKIRNLIRSNNPNHPWLALNDEQMLEKAGLWKLDFQTGQSGYTLAAALLLGKDEVIQQILPHYKIDALVRINDEFRYDDRLYIQINLIEAYEQLMDFVAKHLPDKFFQIGGQRISLRTHIFREIVANIIIHREYTNAHPCTFVIKKGRVETENANNAHGDGFIDLMHFVPFPKNPTLAKFFIQLGRVDELGSGVINVNRFIQEYAEDGKPTFAEGHTFKMTIPIPIIEEDVKDIDGATDGANLLKVINDGVGDNISDGVKRRLIEIVYFTNANKHTKVADLINKFNVSERTIKSHLKILIDVNILEYIGSKKLGYYTLNKNLHDIVHDKLHDIVHDNLDT